MRVLSFSENKKQTEEERKRKENEERHRRHLCGNPIHVPGLFEEQGWNRRVHPDGPVLRPGYPNPDSSGHPDCHPDCRSEPERHSDADDHDLHGHRDGFCLRTGRGDLCRWHDGHGNRYRKGNRHRDQHHQPS
jgi:hypothetical protein